MALLSKLAGAGKGTLLFARAVLLRTAGVANGLRKGLGSSGVLSLQAVLLAGNVLFFTAGEHSCTGRRCVHRLEPRIPAGCVPAVARNYVQ